MLILAVEQSSRNCGLAVLEDEKVVAEREWDGVALRGSGLFFSLKSLLAEISVSCKSISCYVVDIGPGSYSGIRSSLAAVLAFTLPEKQPIYAFSSAEVIAFEILMDWNLKKAGPSSPTMKKNCPGPGKVQVVGDARRRQWWTAVYENAGGNLPLVRQKIGLVPENEFKPDPDALIVSPDWARLKDRLTATTSKGARIVENSCVPTAAALGKLAYRKIRANIPGEPLAPVYLHAAVAQKG